MIRSALLSALPSLAHAHSTRAEGSIADATAEGPRASLVRAVGGQLARLVVPHQHHTGEVAIVAEQDAGRTLERTDGLATTTPGLPLLVQGADCPLVLLHDPEAGATAVVHSGWRGTVARIGQRALDRLAQLGARPDRVLAAVFPGIGPCCFEVGPELADAFARAYGAAAGAWFTSGRGDRLQLDLRAAIVAGLRAGGVSRERTDVVPGCTACGGRLFSHRASGGDPARHGLVALVRP